MKLFFGIVLIIFLSKSLNSQINVILDDTPISDNNGQYVYQPSIAVSNSGLFAVSWGDERDGLNGSGGYGKIYSAIFNKNGNPVTPNFWSDNAQFSPSYAEFSIYSTSNIFLPNETLVIAWHIDARSLATTGGFKSDDVYYSAFSNSGQRLVEGVQLNIKENRSSGYSEKPYIVYLPPTNFLVVYEFSLDGVRYIGGTLVDASTGNLAGEINIISDNEENGRLNPTAASNGTQTIITWTDGRTDASGDIYMQKITGSNLAGGNTKVNDNQEGYNQFSRVAMDSSGNFIIVWIDTRDNNYGDLYAQRYAADGNPVGSNIKLTQSNSVFWESLPAVALLDNGIFITAWTDSLPGKRFTCKTCFFNFETGEPVSEILELTNSFENSVSVHADMKNNGNDLYYTWLDGRESDKGRVYSKILSLDLTSVEEELQPLSFILEQNYPNPFNPSTKISFSLPEKAHVSLKVFDILGKELTDLISEERNPGNYEVDYNAENLANGIYVYQLKAGNFVQSKKMIFLK